MADAQVKSAPLPKKVTEGETGKNGEAEQAALDKVYSEDPSKRYDPFKKYMYELAAKNEVRENPIIDARNNRPAPVQEYKPYQNIVFTSMIIWNGQRRLLRYYDGCTTIFADEQSKDKDTIDAFIRQTQSRNFQNGKFGTYGDEALLLFYMDICSWNGYSEFRTRSASQVFISANADKKINAVSSKIDAMEEALKCAREASAVKMKIHSAYLGLPETDYDSGNELSEKELRTNYRNEAASNPGKFIESYGNKSIEVKFYITQALAKKVIDNSHNPNKATWGKNNTEICDISGLKSHDAIADRLYEFSQTEAGEEFLIQLKALYSN